MTDSSWSGESSHDLTVMIAFHMSMTSTTVQPLRKQLQKRREKM